MTDDPADAADWHVTLVCPQCGAVSGAAVHLDARLKLTVRDPGGILGDGYVTPSLFPELEKGNGGDRR